MRFASCFSRPSAMCFALLCRYVSVSGSKPGRCFPCSCLCVRDRTTQLASPHARCAPSFSSMLVASWLPRPVRRTFVVEVVTTLLVHFHRRKKKYRSSAFSSAPGTSTITPTITRWTTTRSTSAACWTVWPLGRPESARSFVKHREIVRDIEQRFGRDLMLTINFQMMSWHLARILATDTCVQELNYLEHTGWVEIAGVIVFWSADRVAFPSMITHVPISVSSGSVAGQTDVTANELAKFEGNRLKAISNNFGWRTGKSIPSIM